MAPTVVANDVPFTNTGKVRLEVTPPSVIIPAKESIVLSPGNYQVIAHPGIGSIIIAHITYALNGFKVTPTANSVKDARFAVSVNLSEP